MDKAMKILEALLETDADDRIDFDDNAILAGHKGNKEWVYAAEALAELQAYKAKFEELEAKYNQLTHKHDLVCHENCQNLCWENEESYCKEEGCIRNYNDPSLYIDIYKDKYKPRELGK